MKRIVCVLLTVFILVSLTSCVALSKPQNNPAEELNSDIETEELKHESEELTEEISETNTYELLTVKYEREIDGAYKEAMYIPENNTTYGMSMLAIEYAEKWQQVADEYYKKLMEYEDPELDDFRSEYYYKTEDFHEFILSLKEAWEEYYKLESENYVNALHYIYDPGTIVGPLSAQHEYDMKKDWAMKLLSIAEQLGIE